MGTRAVYADAIRASAVAPAPLGIELSRLEMLTIVGYFQPVTRMQIAELLGRPVSRDVIATLRSASLVAAGPRSPQPGAPYTYVTTQAFLERWRFESVRDLPDYERLEEAGLLGSTPLPDELRRALGLADDEGEPADIAADDELRTGLFEQPP